MLSCYFFFLQSIAEGNCDLEIAILKSQVYSKTIKRDFPTSSTHNKREIQSLFTSTKIFCWTHSHHWFTLKKVRILVQNYKFSNKNYVHTYFAHGGISKKNLCGIYNAKWNFRQKISAILHFALVNDGWILPYCVLIVFKNLVKLCRAKDIFTKFQEVARKYIQLGPSLTSWSIGNKNCIYRPKQKRGIYFPRHHWRSTLYNQFTFGRYVAGIPKTCSCDGDQRRYR